MLQASFDATVTAETPMITVVAVGGVHAGAYTEVAETVFYGLQRLGVGARLVSDLSQSVGRIIIVGSFALPDADAAELPPGTIIYNTEHFSFISARPRYMDLLCKHEVWDYSRDNAERLPALLGKSVKYVPLGFVPELVRIDDRGVKDIDVLFYGSSNPRRESILGELRAANLRVHSAFGVYGAARDVLIARAKIVLNIHFYEPGAFEAVRVCYLLANRKAVVTECNPGEYLDADLAHAVLGVPYGQLAEACQRLVADASSREDLEERGFHAFSARDEAGILREAIAERPITRPPTEDNMFVPRRLNLGSGKDWRPPFLNVDRDDYWNPDIAVDICSVHLFESKFQSKRFGDLQLQRGYFDEILAFDVLEHVADLPMTMSNCLNLLRDGGIMRIHVPYDLSFGAWQDPTHVRAFNERSWWYYCQWFWYLGWTEARFDLMRLEYGFSELSVRLKAQGVTDEEIGRTPRAVDQMRVILRKRSLTDQERAEGERMHGGRERDANRRPL
jgi:SAM-dependent methyltransferase